MTVIENAADLTGRILIAGMFVMAGVSKIGTLCRDAGLTWRAPVCRAHCCPQ